MICCKTDWYVESPMVVFNASCLLSLIWLSRKAWNWPCILHSPYVIWTKVSVTFPKDTREPFSGVFWFWWQLRHDLTLFSRSESIPGYHTKLLASPFILVIPGCPWCSSSNTFWRPANGIATQLPNNTQQACTLSSFWWCWYDFRFSSDVLLHPLRTLSLPMLTEDHYLFKFWSAKHLQEVFVECPLEKWSLLVVVQKMVIQAKGVYLVHLHWSYPCLVCTIPESYTHQVSVPIVVVELKPGLEWDIFL